MDKAQVQTEWADIETDCTELVQALRELVAVGVQISSQLVELNGHIEAVNSKPSRLITFLDSFVKHRGRTPLTVQIPLED